MNKSDFKKYLFLISLFFTVAVFAFKLLDFNFITKNVDFRYIWALITFIWLAWLYYYRNLIMKNVIFILKKVYEKTAGLFPIVNQIFQYLILAFLLLSLLEEFLGFKVVNFKYLLGTIIVLGLVVILLSDDKKSALDKYSVLWMWIVAILSAVLIFVKTTNYFLLVRILISVVLFVLILLLGNIIYGRED